MAFCVVSNGKQKYLSNNSPGQRIPQLLELVFD